MRSHSSFRALGCGSRLSAPLTPRGVRRSLEIARAEPAISYPIVAVETIQTVETDRDIAACFEVMEQLRPHLAAADFVGTVRRQMDGGYRLALLAIDGRPCAVAGYRLIENLASGRVLYVDDLVTDANRRSEGHGERLFGWLIERAGELGCNTLELDSGVQRHGAHRFYLARRLEISSYHFRLRLTDGRV